MSPICVQHHPPAGGTFRPTSHTTTGAITNPAYAYDASDSTYAQLYVSVGALTIASRTLVLSGFGSGTFTGTLYIKRSYEVNSVYDDNSAASSEAYAWIRYSLNGTSYTDLESDSSIGGNNNIYVTPGWISIQLSNVNLANLKVQFQISATAGLDAEMNPAAPAYCSLEPYDVYFVA